jgi:S-adenosylmethionine decarboxylase proenzyme
LDGLHIFANLYRCRGDARYLTDRAELRRCCLEAIGNAGLTVLDDLFHQFEGGGTTGCVVLAESHFAIHTWPELGSVTLDAFVCNYSRDNSARARGLVDEVVALFRPADVVRHEVPRDLRARAGRLSLPVSRPARPADAPGRR